MSECIKMHLIILCASFFLFFLIYQLYNNSNNDKFKMNFSIIISFEKNELPGKRLLSIF
jgi:hypothetical protein